MSNWDFLNQGDMIGNFNTDPFVAPEMAPTAPAESKWKRFGEAISKYAPLIIAGLGMANPDQAIMYNTALNTYKQSKDAQAQKEMTAQQWEAAKEMEEREFQETKTKNAWERYKEQRDQNRQTDIDRQNQENKESALDMQEKIARLRSDTDLKIAGIRASDNSGSATAQQKLEQQKAATLVASFAGKYKRREDFLADMKRHRELLVQRMGQENYDKLYQTADYSTNIWPEEGTGAGVNFIPGQGSSIRQWLYGSDRKPLIAGKKGNSGNTSVATKQVRNKKTNEVQTVYVGMKDGQWYTTEEEARLH